MSMQYSVGEFVSRKKLLRKIRQHVERFAWSEAQGRLVPDKRGTIVFLGDIERIIERGEEEGR
jgi:hypothetical protein